MTTTTTKQTRTTLDREIRRVDPDFDKDRKTVVEYQFSTREFTANPANRGAYAEES